MKIKILFLIGILAVVVTSGCVQESQTQKESLKGKSFDELLSSSNSIECTYEKSYERNETNETYIYRLFFKSGKLQADIYPKEKENLTVTVVYKNNIMYTYLPKGAQAVYKSSFGVDCEWLYYSKEKATRYNASSMLTEINDLKKDFPVNDTICIYANFGDEKFETKKECEGFELLEKVFK
jgi:outer membrane lipoprotein-sorting protein